MPVQCKIEGCNYSCKYPSKLKEHLMNKHNIGVKWIHCDECDFKCKNNTNLAQHKKNIHTSKEEINWFYCDVKGCDSKFKTKGNLNHHLIDAHEIGNFTWHFCPHDDCEFKSKREIRLNEHILAIHKSEEVIWLDCELCDRKYKNQSSLNKHIQINHSNIEPIKCSYKNCNYETKDLSTMKKHHNFVHNPDPKWFYCDIENCYYKCKTSYGIIEHKKNKHNIGEIDWKSCELCDFKAKTNSALKSHQISIHNIGVTWFNCDIDNCIYKSKSRKTLDEHKAYIHDINVMWQSCAENNCDYKCKSSSALRTHHLRIHDLNSKNIACNLCDYKCKTNIELKSHQMRLHDIGVILHTCDLCSHKSKTKGDLDIHYMIHNIGIKWVECDLCDSKFKRSGELNVHKKNVHLIGVKYYSCSIDSCNFRSKYKHNLKSHLEMYHDIGKHECQFCYGNRNSQISYTDSEGTHHICRQCYNQVTGKNSKAEKDMSDYLDKIDELTPYLISTDQSFKSIGGCQNYRPDKLYVSQKLVLHIECDENQHKYQSNSYSCDEKRISDIYDEFPGMKYVVIRWNPDTYKNNGMSRPTRNERLKALKAMIYQILDNPPEEQIFIYYMYYDNDNPLLPLNIPYAIYK